MRLGTISFGGNLEVEFTNKMYFPTENLQQLSELIDVIMISGDGNNLDENLKSWKIKSVYE